MRLIPMQPAASLPQTPGRAEEQNVREGGGQNDGMNGRERRRREKKREKGAPKESKVAKGKK